MNDNIEPKSTEHRRSSSGRVMHPNSLKNLRPNKGKVNLRYVSMLTSMMALSVVALGTLLAVTSKNNANLTARLETEQRQNLELQKKATEEKEILPSPTVQTAETYFAVTSPHCKECGTE